MYSGIWRQIAGVTWQRCKKNYVPNFLITILGVLISLAIGLFTTAPSHGIVAAAIAIIVIVWILAFNASKSISALATIQSTTDASGNTGEDISHPRVKIFFTAIALSLIIGLPVCFLTSEQNDKIEALLQNARILSEQEKFAEARVRLDEAQKMLPVKGDALRKGEIALLLGRIERKNGNASLARKHLEDALRLLPESARSHRARAHLELGITFRQRDNRSDARREVDTALRDFRALLDRTGEGRAALELAELHRIEGNYVKALERLNEAATAFETSGSRIGLANVDRTRGVIERNRNRPRAAMQYLEKALNIYRALDSKIGEVDALWQLGEVYVQLDRFDKARTFHQEALRISLSINFPLGVRNAYLALANLEAKRGRLKSAVQEYQKCIDYSHGDQLAEAQARLGLGSVLIKLGNTSDARSQLTAANDRAIILRDAEIQSQVRWNLALLDMQEGHPDKAVQGFRQAFSLAEEASNIAIKAKALLGLGDALVKTHQIIDADKAYERSRLLFRQANMQKSSAIAGLFLARLRLAQGKKKACGLLDEVINEFETINSLEALQLARAIHASAGCSTGR